MAKASRSRGNAAAVPDLGIGAHWKDPECKPKPRYPCPPPGRNLEGLVRFETDDLGNLQIRDDWGNLIIPVT